MIRKISLIILSFQPLKLLDPSQGTQSNRTDLPFVPAFDRGCFSSEESFYLMKLGKVVAVLFVLHLAASQTTYKKYTPAVDQEAQCLDGSPPVLYVHEGGEPKKFLLFFLGGGTCADRTGTSATLESCYQRSMTELGSSLKWPEEISL